MGAKTLPLYADYAEQVGQRIKQRRKALEGNVSQEDMAARVGVTRKTYALYEKGHGPLTLDILYRIATALGLPLEALFVPTPLSGQPVEHASFGVLYAELHGVQRQLDLVVRRLEMQRRCARLELQQPSAAMSLVLSCPLAPFPPCLEQADFHDLTV